MQPKVQVTMSAEPERTRVLMTDSFQGPDILKAVLPPASQSHPRAAVTLLEGLSLWHQKPLCVVLCVDERQLGSSESLCLYDALGQGVQQVHFEVAWENSLTQVCVVSRRAGPPLFSHTKILRSDCI